MVLPTILSAELSRVLGKPVQNEQWVHGGDINQAARFEVDGMPYFVKWNDSAPPSMFPAEAFGLQILSRAGAVRVPQVIAQADARDGCPGYLVLEWIEGSRSGGIQTMEQFGIALAELHRHTAPTHGLEQDNFIGRLPQPNQPTASWIEFYRDQRIGYQMTIARQRGRLPARRESLLTRLLERLPDLLDDNTMLPSLLHGDLWGGNYLVDEQGQAVLIDPAVYYGHREMDLAMTELFGGFGGRFYEAYHATYPMDSGYAERRALYQLYYILVHLNLFGEHYGGQVDSIAAHYVGRQ